MKMLPGISIVLLFTGYSSAVTETATYLGDSTSSRPLEEALYGIAAIVKDSNNISSPLGYLQGKPTVIQEFDYVVVGAGTAGTAMGYRLSEAGYRVALIEAGGYREYSGPSFGTIPALAGLFASSPKQYNVTDWAFFTEPQAELNYRSLHFPQGKGVGGSSNLGYMLYSRPPASFHDQWAELVDDDSYKLANFQQFYKKAATFNPPTNDSPQFKHASTISDLEDFEPDFQGGPIQVSYPNFVSRWATWVEKALRSVGVNATEGFNRGDLLGYQYAQMTIQPGNAARSSSAEYITTAKKKNLALLKVFPKTEARRLFFEKNRATGVLVTAGDTKERYLIKASREVIVSAGVIKSPQLLMVSGTGPAHVLQQNNIFSISALSGVGQNLQDHISFGLSYEVKLKTGDASIFNYTELEEALHVLRSSSRGVLSSNGLELLSFEKLPFEYRKSLSAAETNALPLRLAQDSPEAVLVSANGHIGDYQTNLFGQFRHKNHATILGTLLASSSQGNITIQAADMVNTPVISPNWLTAPSDKQLAIATFKRIRALFQSAALRPVRLREAWPGESVHTDEQILDTIRQSMFTAGHAAGTCKMGRRQDDTAVVDHKARVKGVQGLRVVDASSLPLLPPGYPGATVVAFAEKIAADMIREEQGLE
ncbi:hypothetical protein E4U54_002865 [Claviceps lovelessii]|nr:hypothetical protein E4U54_002865 [Claviceps lovelessii]